MTIITTQSRVTYAGDNVTVLFPIPFEFFLNSDITAVKTAIGGAVVSLVQNVDYTLSGANTPGGGSATKTTPLLTGETMALFLSPPITQGSHYLSNAPFPAATLENDIDRQTQISQRLNDQLIRSIRFPDSDPNAASTLLPSAIARALTNLGFDAAGNVSLTQALASGTLSAASIGSFITPQTAAEGAAGVAIVNNWYPVGNVLRYGIVPNSSGAAAANTAILVTLLNPSIANGPTGLIYFPNNGSGAPDTYFFGSAAPAQIRTGVTLDLNGCILNFSGAFASAMSTFGFFTVAFDTVIRNGTIQINYNGTGGTNNGAAIRIGSRSGYGFGIYPTGIFDQDNLAAGGLPLQGNIVLENLRITSNNPATHIIFATGGLRALHMRNVWIDGQSVVPNNGFYYEYGWSSTNGAPGTLSSWTSSHMTASSFRNIVVTNLAMGGTSQGFGFNGAYDCTVEDIYVNGADQGFGFSTGEAMFFRVWALDVVSPARQLTLRNLTALNLRTLALALGGSNPVGAGYLAAVIGALAIPQRYQAQTDLLSFSVDGFSLTVPTATGSGIIAQGSNIALRNGTVVGGAVNFGAEAMNCTMENVNVLNSGGPNGVRFGITPIWVPTRQQNFAIRTCKIAGSTGVAIAAAVCSSGIIENCQLGYNTTNDVATEATQTNGVNLALTSFGVKCRGNSITTAGGAVAYQSVNNTVNNMNSIENERITQTTGGGGAWDTDFQSPTAQVIATAGTIISQSLKTIRLAPVAAVTGVIMQSGQKDGQQAFLLNESTAANSITFAASGTSRVAGGVGVVLAGVTKMILVWDSATNLWY